MFPGSSTINQIEKIVELAGHPSDEIIKGISTFAPTMMQSLSSSNKGGGRGTSDEEIAARWREKLPQASDDAIDMLQKLLAFEPEK